MSDKGTKYIFNYTKCIFFKCLRHQQQKKILKGHCRSAETFPPYFSAEAWIDYPDM